MIDLKTLRVGDTAYIIRSGSWSSEMLIVTVSHTTPTGRVTVLTPTGRPIEFNKSGDEKGEKFRGWRISDKETYDSHIKHQQMKKDERDIASKLEKLPKLGYDEVLTEFGTIRDMIDAYKETYGEA